MKILILQSIIPLFVWKAYWKFPVLFLLIRKVCNKRNEISRILF